MNTKSVVHVRTGDTSAPMCGADQPCFLENFYEPANCRDCQQMRARAIDFIALFRRGTPAWQDENYWIFSAAARFANYHGGDVTVAAIGVLNYFLPSGDARIDSRRVANGYIVTDDFDVMLRVTLNAAS